MTPPGTFLLLAITSCLCLAHLALSTTTYFDIYGKKCATTCSQTEGDKTYDYFFCYLDDGNWEYCSPVRGVTRYNNQCRKSHKCNQYGKDYFWCRTVTETWDYCSIPLVEDDNVELPPRFDNGQPLTGVGDKLSPVELLEAALSRSFELANANLEPRLIGPLVRKIYGEVETVSEANNLNLDQLHNVDLETKIKDLQEREFDFTFKEQSYLGRFNKLGVSFTNLVIGNQASVDAETIRGLKNQILNLNLSYIKNDDDVKKYEDIVDSRKSSISVENLFSRGAFRDNLFVCKDSVGTYCDDDDNLVKFRSAMNVLEIEPIRAEFFAFHPGSVKMVEGSVYSEEKFSFEWRPRNDSSILRSTFTYFKPSTVEAKFQGQFEFQIVAHKSPSWIAATITLGSFYLFYYDNDSAEFSTSKFDLTMRTSSDSFKPRSKLFIEVTELEAMDFLTSMSKLEQLKKQLGQLDDIQKLQNSTKKELANATAIVNQITNEGSFLNTEEILLLEESLQDSGLVSNTPGSLPLSAIPWKDRLKMPDYMSILDEAAQRGILEVIEKKKVILDKHDSFASLAANADDLKGLSGFLFEEMTAGRILADAERRGLKLLRVAGDGKGDLGVVNPKYQGMTTPEHSDLVFYDVKQDKFLSYQLKFTDNVNNAEGLIKNFFETHGNRELAGLPPGLDVAETKIVLPAGVAEKVGPVEVEIRGAQTKVQPVSSVDFGAEAVGIPSVKEVASIWDKNFAAAKAIASEGTTGLVGRAKTIIDNLAKIGKKVRNIFDQVERIDSGINDNARRGLTDKLTQLDGHLDEQLNELLSVETKLKKATSEISTTEVDFNKGLRTKSMMKMLALQGIATVFTDVVISLTISLDQNIRLYKEGKITSAELAAEVAKQTAVPTAIGFTVFAGYTAIYSYTSTLTSTFGKVTSNALGPAVFLAAAGYQTYSIINSYDKGQLTALERNKSLGRMAVTTTASFGMAAAASSLVTAGLVSGPVGILIGVGAAIAVSLLDYFLGGLIASYLFGNDFANQHEKLEEVVFQKAYALFELTEFCTDDELREGYRVALLKYHPDRNITDKEETEKNTLKTQAIVSAYTILKERRKMSKRKRRSSSTDSLGAWISDGVKMNSPLTIPLA